jgi:hypothetical protein
MMRGSKSSEAELRLRRGSPGTGTVRWKSSALALAVLAGLVLLGGCSPDGDQLSAARARPEAAELWGDAGAIQEILLEPDALVRAEALAAELRSLAPLALDDVLSAYDTVFLDVGDFELELLAEWWARFDPEAAYAWSQKDWRATHPVVAQAVLRAWARSDPAAALRAAEQESRDAVRRASVGAVLVGWEQGGAPGSFEYVRSLPAGHDRQRYLAFVARRKVLRDGVEAAIRWAESQPDEPQQFKLNLFRRVASAAAQVEPLRAAAWAEEQLSGPFGSQLPQRVGTRWAVREPEAAMEWFAGLPAGFEREAGLRETYRVWLGDDKTAAHAWMAEREPAAWLDPARALYAMSLYKDPDADPLIALEQALSISAEQLRWATVGRIWRVWYVRNAEAAEAWFVERESGIPPFYRARIPTIPSGMLKAAGVDLPSFLEDGEPESPDEG